MFKPRSKLGAWLDRRGISQMWLSKQAGVSEETVSQLCNNPDKLPTMRIAKKVLDALRKVDPNVKQDQFWSM